MSAQHQRLLLFLLAFFCVSQVCAADNYVSIALPQGIRLEVPTNWEALSRNQRITLDSSVQARSEKLGLFDASSDLNFAANHYDDAGKVSAAVNIRYYSEITLTQADARAATASDIQELDGVLKSSLVQAGQAAGYSILRWVGTSPRTINGTATFITEYERSPINNNGTFRVRLVRVFKGSSSFTVTVSYRAKDEYLLRPICDRIISSITA